MLHYAQEIFEGIKAYRHADGSIRTFRPDQNAARLQRSAARLALPELPSEYFIESLRAAHRGRRRLGADRRRDQSLYLRPFMFAKEAFLGVRPAQKVAYYVIASPAGAYFHGGVQPVSIWLSDGLRPRRQGRHGCGEDRRQLRREPAAAGRGVRARMRAGACSSTRTATSRSSAA